MNDLESLNLSFKEYGLMQSKKIAAMHGEGDIDSFEKFITVLNSVFGTNHPFGTPVKAGTVGGVTSQLYSLNTIPDQQVAVSYSASVASKTSNFEICN
mgnify:CR=1 FL=1